LAVGDYMIALQVADGDGDIASMTGYPGFSTRAPSVTGSGSVVPRHPDMRLWGKFAESADVDATSFPFPASGAANSTVILMAIQAGTFDPAAPLATAISTNGGSSFSVDHVAPSVTGVVSGLLITCYGADTNGTVRNYVGTPAGMTPVAARTGGTFTAAAVYREALTSTAATGVRTASLDSAAGWGTFSVVVNPSPDAAPPPPLAVRARVTGAQNTDSATHAITLPSGITAGEHLIVAYGQDTATTTITGLTNGWQQLSRNPQGTTNNHTGYVLWKKADGTDALTVSLSNPEQATWSSLAITGADPAATPTVAGLVYGAATASPQTETMPALSGLPLGDYLAIVAIHTDSNTTQAQTFTPPSGYSNGQTINPTGASSAASFTCERIYTGVSAITPGAASWGVFEQGAAATIAIGSAANVSGDASKTASDSSGTFEAESVTYALTDAEVSISTDSSTAIETAPALKSHSDIRLSVENESVLVLVTGADSASSVDTPGGGIYSGGGVGQVAVEGVDIAAIQKRYPPLPVADVETEGIEGFAGGTKPDVAASIVEGVEGVLSRAGVTFSAIPVPDPAPVQRARLLAQSILTGEWISTALPVTDPVVTWNLSAATTITGSFKPEISELADAKLEPWATWIYLEEDQQIRAAGILQPGSISHDGTLSLDAVGPHGYAQRIPYRDRYSGIRVDPADVVRMLWAHIQGFERGRLGVTVVGNTQVLKGTEPRDVSFTTEAGEQVDFVAGPYTLDYWQNTMIGREIESLATETPFDFWEEAEWTTPARRAVAKRIMIRFPQAGERRFDLRFVEGENIIESAAIEEPADAYADTVYVAGKGEGADQVAGSAMRFLGNRLRLPAVVTDKSIESVTRAKAVAADELAARLAALVEIPEIVIDARHRNAPLGSFSLGDEIPVQVRYPYLGTVQAWHRIITIRYLPLADRAVLSLTRRGEFQQ